MQMQRIAVSIGTLQLHWENFANEAKECNGIGACLLSEIIDAADFMQRFLDHLLDRSVEFVGYSWRSTAANTKVG